MSRFSRKGSATVLGAILVVASEISSDSGFTTFPQGALYVSPKSRQPVTAQPLACVEVLGCSTVDRMVELFHRTVGGTVSVISDKGSVVKALASATGVRYESAQDPWAAVIRELKKQREDGIRATFVIRVGNYLEFDPFDMFQFHVEQRQGVTRAFQNKDLLDLWIVNTADLTGDQDISSILRAAEGDFALYPLTGYVNRLSHPRDLRKLVADSFNSICQLRPQGREVRSRVWLDADAQVSRKARIVGPAYIGRGSKVRERCLITRGTNIEKDCEIDYGTVVEDSAVFAGTYVGLCLDISRSIVNGTRLLNLEHDLVLEIDDPGLIREKRAAKATREDLKRVAGLAWSWADRLVDTGMEAKKVA